MWEAPPPDTAGRAAGNGQEGLTPAAIESVLADFRSWLEHLAVAPAAPQGEEPAQALDLHTLLGQSIALRHEVNLQTKAARSQQEQTGLALQQLSQALEALRKAQAAAQELKERAEEESLRPLLKTLLDVYDALSLAAGEIRRAPETILPLLDELRHATPAELGALAGEPEALAAPPLPSEPDLEMATDAAAEAPAPPAKTSFWQRFLGCRRAPDGGGDDVRLKSLTQMKAQQQRLRARLQEQHQALVAQRAHYERLLRKQRQRDQHEKAAHAQQRERICRARQRLEQFLDAVLTGYRMGLQRLERALEHSGLEPIPCLGQTFDPERMEVVAAVADSGRPPGAVIEEVRRGYLWHGRVFRYAQVTVAKS